MKHYYNVKSYARTPEIQEHSSLIDIQLKSFEDFLYRGRLLELFDEINPIESFNGNLLLYFPGNIPEAREFGLNFRFEEPKYDEDACLERDMSYASPLHVRVALVNRAAGYEIRMEDIFLGDFPLMTEKGTFIINGTERVVVSQLIRSPGVYFDVEEERATGRSLSNAKMIPDRGAWMEFETRKTDYITIKFNRKRTIPVTVLLRALAAVDDGLPPEMSPVKTGNDDEMRRLFADLDTDEAHPYIESSLKNEPEWDVKKKQTIAEVALIEFYRRMRPGDPPTLDNARNYLEGQLFDQRRYDLERVGRHKLNQRRRDLVKKLEELGREGAIEVLGLKDEIDPEHRTMTKADIVALVAQMILINNGQGERNDIDHLGNRRVKTVGELIGNKLRIGLRRMERVVRERMSIREAEQLTPVSLVNIRPIVAAVREFFGSSQLSQFMEQTNPLSELTHKRTLSALGPGGLRRERAGFDVRDVHHSHYGRICPIETPEGPNIGLIGRLASYARVNELGFIETPYRKVVNELPVVLTNKVRAPEDIVVSRKVTRPRKVTESLIGYESSDNVEVAAAVQSLFDNLNEIRNTSLKQSENALHGLGEELRGGGGVRASLQQIRGEAEKGKFPDGETIKQYRCKIDEPVRAYQETVRTLERKITQLQSHPEIVRISGDQAKVLDFAGLLDELEGDTGTAIVGLKDMEAAVSEGVTNEEEFNKAVAKALKGVNNLQERIPAIVGGVQAKIDEAISHPLDEGVKSRIIIVKKGDIIDADILKALKEHDIKKVKAVSYVGNKALIGREVYDDINDINGRTIVEMDTVIDAGILNVLVEHGIKKVKVVTYLEKRIVNPDLIGRTVRDDIEAVIVKEGTVIDATAVKELRKHGIKEVKVVEGLSIPTSEVEYNFEKVSNKDLLGQVIAEDIEAVIVEEGTIIDAKVVRKLKKHGIKEVKAVEGLSIPTSVKEVKPRKVFTPNWVESDTNEYNFEKVSNKDLLGQVVAEDIEAVVVVAGTEIDATAVKKLKKHGIKEVKVETYTATAKKVDDLDLIGRAVSKGIVVSRKVTRSRKVTESLIGYESSYDVEVATLEKSRQAVDNLNKIRNTSLKQSEDALHGLGEELRGGGGVRASLQQIRGKAEKGKFPDGETIKQYRRKIDEPVRAYQETIKTLEREITQLQSHPEIVRISGDQAKVLDFAESLDELEGDTDRAIVGLEDMEAAISAGVTNKEEFNKAVAEALISVNNLQERIPAIVRDVQRKIDANPLLSDEGVKSPIIIVKKGDIIDADILKALKEHGIKKVKIEDDKEEIIAEAGTVIDAKIVRKLKKQGIKEVKVETKTYSAKKVNDPDLIGYKAADDIEAVIVAGTEIDAEILEKLVEQDIEKVKVETYVGNKDLIGRSVYDTIKGNKGNVIVKASAKINARILKKLVEQDIKEVKVETETYIAKKVDDPDLIGYKAADDIEAVTVEEDTIIDAKVVRKLKKHGIKKVKVVIYIDNPDLIGRAVSKGIVVSRKVTRSRKVTESLIGYESSDDVEVAEKSRQAVQSLFDNLNEIRNTSLKQSEDALHGLGEELRRGDGVRASLQQIRGKAEEGEFPDGETIKQYRCKIDEPVRAYQETIRKLEREITQLQSHPELDELEGDTDRAIVGLKDMEAAVSEGVTNEEEFNKAVAEALKGVINLQERIPAIVEGMQAKIDEAINHLPDEDRIQIEGGIDNLTIVKKGDIIDADILKALKEHGIKKVKIEDDKEEIIAEAGTVIDAKIVRKLRKHGIKEVKVETKTYTAKKVGDPDLIGYKAADDIEAVIVEEDTVVDAKVVRKLKKYGIEKVPVVPFATYDIEYLSADTEDRYRIAQANSHLDERNQFVSRRVSARHDQKFLTVLRDRLDYMDIAPRQIVGISAALIPFLSHDDANRALMGSNMQRQAVPLLTPDVSVVSTGMESQAASDSGQVLVSDIEAEVVSVQGHRVIVKTKEGEELVYPLRKYDRSNQSTCIDQRPLVRKGDTIKPGDVIADSSSTYEGRLALGHDVLTCFLSWDGGNYEDALLVSEDMLRNDKFTSIHIEKHEIEARDTKLGPEEITYDIPNVGEEALKDLDERGIVRIGAEVGPNDILVGKITPKGEKELSPEEKLLRAIFGEQAREVKDSSLRLPHGDRGKVVDVKIFTRDEYPDLPAGVEKMVRVSVAQRRKLTVGDKMSGRHGNKGVISKIVPIEDMPYIEGGVPVEIILNPLGVPGRMNIGQILELHLGWAADRLGFRAVTPVFDGAREDEIRADLGRAWMIDWAWKYITERAWENAEHLAEMGQMKLEEFDDDMHVICAYLVHRVGESGEYDNEAIILERDEIYVRRVAVAEVLREFGYAPDEVMVYNNEGLSNEERDRRDQNALRVSLCLWIGQNAEQEVELGDDLEIRDLFKIADQVMFETGSPVPHYGKQRLYDGRTGEPFDRDVAVGYVHMLKLAHLVEDKAHARSTGPYSLVTQQPLGGKAQFGGQRFGEMEVWALEAYGAAYILQEMLTVKSDDVQGRVKTYESIVKGEDIEEPGIPTSFRVLVKELQSLGLAVEAITSSGDVIRFGKDDEQARRPQPATGLLRLGSN